MSKMRVTVTTHDVFGQIKAVKLYPHMEDAGAAEFIKEHAKLFNIENFMKLYGRGPHRVGNREEVEAELEARSHDEIEVSCNSISVKAVELGIEDFSYKLVHVERF